MLLELKYVIYSLYVTSSPGTASKTEDTGDLNSDNDIYKYRPRAGHSSQERTLNSSRLCANSSLDRLDVRCGSYQFLICRMDHN